MLISKIMVGIASVVALVSAAQTPKDLGTVIAKHKKLSTFYKLIKKYPEILMQLPNYKGVTIVAPSNDAFDEIPYSALSNIWDEEDRNTTIALLQYHILKGTVDTEKLDAGPAYLKSTLLTDPKYTNVTGGQNIMVTKQPDVVVFTTRLGSRATVINNDISFQGGLIQIVDSVLVPPSRLREAAEITKVKSFLGALYASDLMPDLADEKDITVFAPRTQAMEAIGGSLSNMKAKELARVMGYHIIPGKVVVSSELKNATSLETLTSGKSVHIRQIGNNKYINSAKIIETDILLANGILHVISNVNNPDDPDAVPDPGRWAQTPVFRASEADDPFETDIPCTVSCQTATPKATKATTTRAEEAGAMSTPASSEYVFSRSSTGLAGARATAHIAKAALGIVGLGAGMAFL